MDIAACFIFSEQGPGAEPRLHLTFSVRRHISLKSNQGDWHRFGARIQKNWVLLERDALLPPSLLRLTQFGVRPLEMS
jgi:hypothetical protein